MKRGSKEEKHKEKREREREGEREYELEYLNAIYSRRHQIIKNKIKERKVKK